MICFFLFWKENEDVNATFLNRHFLGIISSPLTPLIENPDIKAQKPGRIDVPRGLYPLYY
jgi:hypothetical protein